MVHGDGWSHKIKVSYTVLARRYRPEGFSSLVGQKNVSETLMNAIKMKRIGHAYLFTGPRGVGKTSAARILAKALNCEKGTSPTPCLRCPTCEAISKGKDSDVIEIDGASNNGVDDIREIRESAQYAPIESPYKIFIIDEVHMVTRAGFNALLKILEEPPEFVVFIFATTEAHKIPETILSRCQNFDFRAIGEEDISLRLKQILEDEKIEMSESARLALARFSDGGMRNAQSSLDQLITYAGGEKIEARHLSEMMGILTEVELIEILSSTMKEDFQKILEKTSELKDLGVQPIRVLNQLQVSLRLLLRMKHFPRNESHGLFSEEAMAAAQEYAKAQSDQGFLAASDLIQKGRENLARGLDPFWALEMTLMNLAHLGKMPTISELMGHLVGSKKKTLHS